MEQATVETVESGRPVGSKYSRTVIGRWNGPALRAVSIVLRPDVALELPSMAMRRYWPLSRIWKRRLEKRLGERPWQSQVLPDYTALALDGLGSLHFLALQRDDRILAEVKEELRQWPISDVKVTITSDTGWWRPVEISDGTGAYVVVAAFFLPGQRSALRMIAESSRGG